MRVISAIAAFIIIVILVSIPAYFVIYKISFGVPVESGQINALFQSNFQEALDFVDMYISRTWVFIVTASSLILLGLLIRQSFIITKTLTQTHFISACLFLFILVNLEPTNQLQPYVKVKSCLDSYNKELLAFEREKARRKSGEIKIDATKEGEKELYVIIIGESLNKNHMGLYGYHRNTTPKLSERLKENDITILQEAYSSHTHTIPVLTRALTQANSFNGRNYYNSPSIIEMLELADFDTYWISNQILFGGWDNPVSVIADDADKRISMNTNIGEITQTIFYDAKLIQSLDNIISKGIKKNTVVFVHLMGNHGEYSKRYTDFFKKYRGDLPIAEFGKAAEKHNSLNHYDNSVFYNDFVVDSLLKVTKKYAGTSAAIYFADHGEDVFGRNGHNVGRFNFSMVQIPLLTWFSDNYKIDYPEKEKSFIANSAIPFSTDFIYDLCLGLTGVNTTFYSATNDPLTDVYDAKEGEEFIVEGSRTYNESENIDFHKRNNTRFLAKKERLNRIFPHRVNSLGKWAEAYFAGHRAFEIDLLIRENDEGTHFEVGHDENAMSGISLDSFLTAVNSTGILKIWLDMKNLNPDNLSKVLDRLIYLDGKFELKDKLIVESSIRSDAFRDISKAGFHTSYYLPTGLQELNSKEMIARCGQIQQQIKLQDVSAISFDIALYPLVQKYIESGISSEIIYHTWDLSLQLGDSTFQSKLKEKGYLNDARIKSILVGFSSNYNL